VIEHSTTRESEVALAFSAVFREAGIEHELEGAYLTEMGIAAGRYAEPYTSSDVLFGLKLRERDSDAKQAAQSEQRRREAGRYGGATRNRMRRQEDRAGVLFSKRTIPPGRDRKGHRHAAQIHFPFGRIIQEVIAKATATRIGRRSTRFETAAAEILASHRQEVGLLKPKHRQNFPFSISFEARARTVLTHLTEMKNFDPQLTAEFLRFSLSELKLASPEPLSPDDAGGKKAPPCTPLLSFLVTTSQGTNPPTDHVGGFAENRQQNSRFLSAEARIEATNGRAALNRCSADAQGEDESTLTADLFQSVRAGKFSFVLKNDETLDVESEQRQKSRKLRLFKRADFDEKFSELQGRSCAESRSLIIGARSQSQIHLDDCSLADAARLAPYAFAVIETSPNRFHVFLALRKGWDRRETVRRRLIACLKFLSPESEANSGSGSVRWPGTQNFKPERCLPDGGYFTVRLVHASPALFTTEKELDDVGLLGQVETLTNPLASIKRDVDRKPDYGRILAQAPPATSARRKGLPDRSWADFSWCRMYASWGANQSQIESGLVTVSACARERGSQYVTHQALAGADASTPWVSDSPRATA
jgi:hypothetical protein